jgi:4'-phosphopantetheinyl transferase
VAARQPRKTPFNSDENYKLFAAPRQMSCKGFICLWRSLSLFLTFMSYMRSSDPGLRGRNMKVSLTPDTVVVWWMLVDGIDCEVVARWRKSLDVIEQARADRFHFTEDGNTYIAAHALNRALLAWAGGLPASAWRFITAHFGKPQIDPILGVPRIQFNLSHTRGVVACAISLDRAVGVDVEVVDETRDVLRFAEHAFSPAEITLLRAAAPLERPAIFNRIWTLKEAYIKAKGQGLNCPLCSFGVTLDPPGIQLVTKREDTAANWLFAQRRLTCRHVLALAVHGCTKMRPVVAMRRVESHEVDIMMSR